MHRQTDVCALSSTHLTHHIPGWLISSKMYTRVYILCITRYVTQLNLFSTTRLVVTISVFTKLTAAAKDASISRLFWTASCLFYSTIPTRFQRFTHYTFYCTHVSLSNKCTCNRSHIATLTSMVSMEIYQNLKMANKYHYAWVSLSNHRFFKHWSQKRFWPTNKVINIMDIKRTLSFFRTVISLWPSFYG